MRLSLRLRRHHQDNQPDKLALNQLISSSVSVLEDVGNDMKDEEFSDNVTHVIESSDHQDTEVDHTYSDHENQKFAEVLRQLNFKRVPQLATRIRMSEERGSRAPVLRHLQNIRYGCKIISPALHGSHNILLPIRFRDGVQWLLKIPADGGGDGWKEHSARALNSEVLTMKLIYNNSSIPVPRIYSFDSRSTNELNVPYILMERIDGLSLFQRWFPINPPHDLDRFREQALANIAQAMVQLNSFVFSKAGSLQYSLKDKAVEVGSYRKVDFFAEYAGMKTGQERVTSYSQQGPFDDPKDYFLSSLDKENATLLSHTLQGQRMLLRLFIKWFFQAAGDSSGFVLTHPDFNSQNILVGKDGSLKGFVDWDGVVAVPRCIGCEEYPLWLTSDWDPLWWNYNTEDDCVIVKEDPVMTPKELDHYRAIYARAVETALHQNRSQSPIDRRQGSSLRPAVTKVSSLARSLYISANEPLSLPYSVSMIFTKISDLTAGDGLDDPSGDNGSDTNLSVHDNVEKDSDSDEPGIPDIVNTQETAPDDTKLETISRLIDIGNTNEPGVNESDQHTEPEDMKFCHQIVACQSNHTSANVSDRNVQQPEPFFTSDKGGQWWHKAMELVQSVSFCLLSVPAWFILAMDWLQSSDISPIYAFCIGLIFSDWQLLARFVTCLLGGLCLAWMIDKTFQDRPRASHERSEQLRHITSGAAKPPQHGSKHLETIEHQEPAVAHENLDTTMNISGDDCRSESGDAVADDHLSTTPSATQQLTLENIKIVGGNDEIIRDNAPDSSSSSGDRSSRGRLITPLTDPDIGAESDHVGIDEDDGSEDSSVKSLTREQVIEMMHEKWDEDPTYDFGIFTQQNIYNALYKDSLDAGRMRRLKVGFQRLLASLDDRFADFDGLTLND
ncbi:MAG: hypothetical protein LQ343_007458 [Gyalolechia ehrenbergii]|nr:MAG: hypothetical protein LQ343_007458 [Gyalolechia ehrenbergii]